MQSSIQDFQELREFAQRLGGCVSTALHLIVVVKHLSVLYQLMALAVEFLNRHLLFPERHVRTEVDNSTRRNHWSIGHSDFGRLAVVSATIFRLFGFRWSGLSVVLCVVELAPIGDEALAVEVEQL